MFGFLFIVGLICVMAFLYVKFILSPSTQQSLVRMSRAAVGPLVKRGWQSEAKKDGFKLKPLQTSYPFEIDLERLARYLVVCQIPAVEKFGQVPLLYPEATCISSELLELLLGPGYPFPVMGSVHVRNWTRQERAIHTDEKLTMTAKIVPEVVAVKRGSEVTTELSLTTRTGETVWKSNIVYLVMHRHKKTVAESSAAASASEDSNAQVIKTEEWKLAENTGRVYGGVSLDFNPIHLHGIFAKLFGFPQMKPIAHGLYTSARAYAATLDAAQDQLKYPLEAEVFFKRPVVLPSTATLNVLRASTDRVSFTLETKGKRLIDGFIRNAA